MKDDCFTIETADAPMRDYSADYSPAVAIEEPIS